MENVKTPITILLVDPYAIEREGLRLWLSKQPDMAIVGEAADGPAALALVRQLAPDVVLLADGPSRIKGLEIIRQILRERPVIKILALSSHRHPDLIAELFQAGAAGHVARKDADDLPAALRAVTAGLTPGKPPANYFAPCNPAGAAGAGPAPSAARLTDQERRILQFLTEGKSTRQIADRLNLSPKTVESHRHQIMQKLNIHNVAELTKFALVKGIISLEK